MEEIINQINGVVWSNALIILCLGTGIYFSVVTRFLQLRYIKQMVHLLFKGKSSKTGVSSFQAFSIAVAGRVGTGNIAGVATAIAMGGPGSIFWMWVVAFLGSASAFIESVLAQVYKEVKDGQYRGGPAFYIQKGLGIKWFAATFAIITLVSSAAFFPGVQSNTIAASMENAFSIPPIYSGVAVTLLVGLVIFGGVRRIGKTAEIIVPFMAILYLLMAVVIIILNIGRVPEIFSLITKSAFAAEPAFAGIFGMAVSWGVKRGIYSNEAGLGTAPHAAAAAETSHPVKQGLVQAFSVYLDTLLVCTATAFMILFTGQYNVADPSGGFIVNNLPGVAAGSEYTQNAVSVHFPFIGPGFVAVSLLLFAFTTIVAYYYIAETNLSFLQKQGKGKWQVTTLRLVLLVSVYYGSIRTAEAAWALGDMGVGLVAWLNVIAILLLRKPALKALKDYQAQRKAGIEPVFDPNKLGIKHAEVWEK
ncbi:alanine/glycine:cation symporter family protein [Aridibaculum aurantiacum]|uniref:alanine/glycine:cation symporter family protein n=1 Tax=Aridibaculum aurantiacum TaxID=2810307 RepID=UPI001A97B9F3|nr:alanine/glycine:cation symporter family protein [Aridibaculum aurantiacum]